jgi:hypothetical protein
MRRRGRKDVTGGLTYRGSSPIQRPRGCNMDAASELTLVRRMQEAPRNSTSAMSRTSTTRRCVAAKRGGRADPLTLCTGGRGSTGTELICGDGLHARPPPGRAPRLAAVPPVHLAGHRPDLHRRRVYRQERESRRGCCRA